MEKFEDRPMSPVSFTRLINSKIFTVLSIYGSKSYSPILQLLNFWDRWDTLFLTLQ